MQSLYTRPQTICADTSYLPCWWALLLPVSINRSEPMTQAPASTDVICAGGPRKCPQAQIAFICAGGGHVSTRQCPKNFMKSAHNIPKISSPATSSLCLFIIYLALSSPCCLSLSRPLISFSQLSLPLSSPWWPAGLGLAWQQGAARLAGDCEVSPAISCTTCKRDGSGELSLHHGTRAWRRQPRPAQAPRT